MQSSDSKDDVKKTSCWKCGASILMNTANTAGGLCMPCSRSGYPSLKQSNMDIRLSQLSSQKITPEPFISNLPHEPLASKFLSTLSPSVLPEKYIREATSMLDIIGKEVKSAVPALAKALALEDNLLSHSDPLGPEVKTSVPFLVQALKEGDHNVRRTAILTLMQILPQEKEAVLAIALALHDEDKYIRTRALVTIQLIGSEAVPIFRSALEDQNALIRMAASNALVELGIDARDELEIDAGEVIPSLIQALEHSDDRVSEIASHVLGRVGNAAASDLIQAMKDTHPSFLSNPLRSLKFILSKSKGENFQDKDFRIRYFGTLALGFIAKNEKDLFPGIITTLIENMRDKNDQICAMAFGALKIIGPKAKEAIPNLINVLNKDEAVARKYAALVLGNIGSEAKSAVPALAKALQDEYQEVRSEALEALEKIGGFVTVNALVKHLTYWHLGVEIARVLNRMDWEPKSEVDKIHLLVAQRNGRELRDKWSIVKTILLQDIEANNYSIIENALYAFIGIGRHEIIPLLVEKLNVRGTRIMAEAFLNCGFEELHRAAKEWASKHGYTISTGPGAHPINWGQM